MPVCTTCPNMSLQRTICPSAELWSSQTATGCKVLRPEGSHEPHTKHSQLHLPSALHPTHHPERHPRHPPNSHDWLRGTVSRLPTKVSGANACTERDLADPTPLVFT